MDKNRTAQLEALLFVAGEPVSYDKLARQLGCEKIELSHAIGELDTRLKQTESGLALVQTDFAVGLASSSATSALVQQVKKQELDRDIGQAGLEILAVLLYRGASTRAVIDHIRGVNSSSTVRSLLARGLIERIAEGREYLYRPSPELIAFIGVTSTKDLPLFSELKSQIDTFEKKTQVMNAAEDAAQKDLEYDHADN